MERAFWENNDSFTCCTNMLDKKGPEIDEFCPLGVFQVVAEAGRANCMT